MSTSQELSCDLRTRARQRPRAFDADRPYVCETAKLAARGHEVRLPIGRLGEYTLTRDEYYAQLAELS